jgi:3-hydroxybutyrate dehydrogenase
VPKGKSALITGYLGGIGIATAKALTAEGRDVMLNGFADADTIAARAAEIQAQDERAAHHDADLREPAESRR